MKKIAIENEGGKKDIYLQMQFSDDSEVSGFDLQKMYTNCVIKMGDSLHIQIGENVMFVKEIVQKILDGPYKLLKQIRFELLGLKQEFMLRFMSENFFQICLVNEIGEEIFQLIEEFINIQALNIFQLEFFYKFQIDTHYNQLIYTLVEENLKALTHASFVFEIADVKIEWKQQVIKSIGSMEKVEMISTCWNTILRQDDILSLLNACKLNKYLLIQAQNIIFYLKEPKIGNTMDKELNERQKLLAPFISNKQLFLDISFYKTGFIEVCNVMEMKELWKWIKERASNYISIKMKFSTSAQINKIILPILNSIIEKHQSLCLDSSDLKLEYDLPTKNLSIHFKEDQQQAKAFRPEDWSFIQPFISQYRNTTQKLHVNLENISFRQINRNIYSQIIDFSKINHKICHFTIIAPLMIIQQDIKLKNLWKQHLLSLQILVNYSIKPLSTVASIQKQEQQQQLLKKGSPSLLSKQQQQKQQFTHLQIQAIKNVDNKVNTAVKRYRKNQFDAMVNDLEISNQEYHLNHILKQQQEFLKMVFNKQEQKKSEKEALTNNFLDKQIREKILREYREKVISNSNQEQQMKEQQIKTKIFFFYEQNSKLKNITLKFNMQSKNPEFFNQLVSIGDFMIVHDLHIALQSDTHDGQIDKILKYFSNSKYLKNLKFKLLCNNLTQLLPKLTKFIKSSMKELETTEFNIEGPFKGTLNLDCIKNITQILPFQEQSQKFKSGTLKFLGLNNLQNTQSMMEIFRNVESEQVIDIKTQNLEITKDAENNIVLKVDCNTSILNNIFDPFVVIHQTYKQFSISNIDIIVNEQQFESFFSFAKVYLEQIKVMRVVFMNIDQDDNKSNTYDHIRTMVYSYQLYDQFELVFRDRNSKEDTFNISYKQNIQFLDIYFQGNQVYSDDFNYDRLINICANLEDLYSNKLVSLKLELIFDNNARFQRCKLDVFKIKSYLYKNLSNLRKFFAVVKVMNQFQRTFETHRVFDEQIRAIQTKDKCISKYALLYKGILNSSINGNYRKEMIWDSISLMIFGQLHLNLKPNLSKRFLLNQIQEEQPFNLTRQNSAEIEEFGILSLFQQERESTNQRQTSIFNQNPFTPKQTKKLQSDDDEMIIEEQNDLVKKGSQQDNEKISTKMTYNTATTANDHSTNKNDDTIQTEINEN